MLVHGRQMLTTFSWQFWPLLGLFLALVLNNRALFRAQAGLVPTAAAELAAHRALLFIVQYLCPVTIATLIFAERRWGQPAFFAATALLLGTALLGNGRLWWGLRGKVPAPFLRLQIQSLLLMQSLLALVLFAVRR